MHTENISDELCWYVVQTQPKQEDRADKNLNTCGLATLSPKIKKARYNQFTGKPTYVTGPLFPGYIFARFSINDSYHKVRFTRGVWSVVSLNGFPAPVDDSVIDMIQARIGPDGYVATGAARLNREEFSPGDEVIIRDGLLKEFSGVFERTMPDGDRVRILLQTLNYQIHAEVSLDQVIKVKSAAVIA